MAHVFLQARVNREASSASSMGLETACRTDSTSSIRQDFLSDSTGFMRVNMLRFCLLSGLLPLKNGFFFWGNTWYCDRGVASRVAQATVDCSGLLFMGQFFTASQSCYISVWSCLQFIFIIPSKLQTMDTMVIYHVIHVTMCQEMDVELGKEVGQELPVLTFSLHLTTLATLAPKVFDPLRRHDQWGDSIEASPVCLDRGDMWGPRRSMEPLADPQTRHPVKAAVEIAKSCAWKLITQKNRIHLSLRRAWSFSRKFTNKSEGHRNSMQFLGLFASRDSIKLLFAVVSSGYVCVVQWYTPVHPETAMRTKFNQP